MRVLDMLEKGGNPFAESVSVSDAFWFPEMVEECRWDECALLRAAPPAQAHVENGTAIAREFEQQAPKDEAFC